MKGLYIHSVSCISAQPTFEGCTGSWGPMAENAPLIEPEYKAYIPPAMLRRMSKVLRMAVTCATDAVKQANLERTDGVVVGTGLGCVRDTLRFMDDMHSGNEGVLSPTAFIQSTHNSMAGQIALSMAIKGYNLTHVQGTLSFEMALMDAAGYLAENPEHTLLVGGMDEQTDELRTILAKLAAQNGQMLPLLGEGSALFVASTGLEGAICRIMEAMSFHSDSALIEKLNALGQVDLVIGPQKYHGRGGVGLDSEQYFGLSFSLSALSTALGVLILSDQIILSELGLSPSVGKIRTVAVITEFAGSFGLIILEK